MEILSAFFSLILSGLVNEMLAPTDAKSVILLLVLLVLDVIGDGLGFERLEDGVRSTGFAGAT